MRLIGGERYVRTAPQQNRRTAPQVWHFDQDCPALDGHDVVKLTREGAADIERLTGKLLRPCRLCSK